MELTFQNQAYFQTYIGASVSLTCALLMIAFLITRTWKLLEDDDPAVSSLYRLHQEEIDLWAQGFMFAITEIPPEYGHIEVYHSNWKLQTEGG